MTVRNIADAKAHLSALLALVEGGEEVIIARAGKPIAKLVKFGPTPKGRQSGTLKDKIWIADDFDAPDPEIEKLFYGE